MLNSPAILASCLRKEFGQNVAVRGLDLEVKRGEVFGFLGPNGAGKTTSIKMFLDLVHPTSGSVEILGLAASDPAARAKIGFLPEHFRFHDWLNANEFLTLHGELYQIPRRELAQRIDQLLELVGLTEFRTKYLKTYSKGMLQRIGLAQAMLNHPALIFLDEPTSGLDPVGRRLVRDIIRTLRLEGTTVFLNSHLLSEVEITCDRVAFIKHGEVLRVCELANLVDGEISLQLRVQKLSEPAFQGLAQWGRDIRKDGDHLQMVIDRDEDLPSIHRFLVQSGAELFAFTPQRVSLEDLFIQIVGTDGGL